MVVLLTGFSSSSSSDVTSKDVLVALYLRNDIDVSFDDDADDDTVVTLTGGLFYLLIVLIDV